MSFLLRGEAGERRDPCSIETSGSSCSCQAGCNASVEERRTARKARGIIDGLKLHFNCQYDEKDSIGKRYRRQDAIGTPYCITVDHDTLENDTVTLRFRDTMEQERVNIADLRGIIEDKVSIASLLKNCSNDEAT